MLAKSNFLNAIKGLKNINDFLVIQGHNALAFVWNSNFTGDYQ